MHERIRRFEAGEGPKPNLGPFSFDEDKGREVARARRWVTRAERELAAARQAGQRAGRAAGRRRRRRGARRGEARAARHEIP